MPNDENVTPLPNSGREEAVRRIRECEKTGQTWLDLGDLALEELPSELGQLKHLWLLALGAHRPEVRDNRVEWQHDPDRPNQGCIDLRPLVKLQDLKVLSLSGWKSLSDLGPLQALTGLTSLELTACESVSNLRPLEALTELISLDVAQCKSLSDLRPLRKLTGLMALYLFYCKSVSDLEPLEGLTRLTTLILYECDSVSELGPLRTLSGLTTLNLGKCKLVSNLEPLEGLTRLTSLDLSHCELVSDLGSLRTLIGLTELNLSGCKLVSELGPLRTLTELTSILFYGCSSVSDLSPLLDLSKLEHINLSNTAVSLPDHLLGSPDASAIMAWYRENKQATGKRPLPEVKLLLVGQGRVGKTQLRLRIFEGKGFAHHDPSLDSTKHIDYSEATHTLPDNHQTKLSQVKLRVWDFGGQNELHSSHRFFLGSQRCFYVLVLAADRPANGETSDSNRLNYWLRVIAEYGRRGDGSRAPVLIVVTRSDVERAQSCREEIDDALEAARKYQWFGANVVEIVRGLGWSRLLSKITHEAIWEQHEAAAKMIDVAIKTHLAAVIDLDQEISPIYHAAKAFVEKAFSKERIDGDSNLRTCIADDDMKRFAELFEQSKAQKTEDERDGLRRDCLGLLNSLGVVHWVGNVPEIKWKNHWNLLEIAFNPEWVRRPVYDLIRCDESNSDGAGLLNDRQIRVLLVERPVGDPHAIDLYDQLPFDREDRFRVLELMKACRLVFDHGTGEGVLVPDLLKSTPFTDEEVPAGTWMYTAEFLPEKVFLRFIARHYDAINHGADQCFRNKVVWRTEGQSVCLQVHYSPPGATPPYIFIRSTTSKQPLPDTVAATVKVLFDEIYKEEQLSHVQRELTNVGKPARLRANGLYVFRYEMQELPRTRNRPARMVPKFTIVFNGVELDFRWTCLVGLGHLHRLIRQPGKLIPVAEFIRTKQHDAGKGYKFRESATKGYTSRRKGTKVEYTSQSLPRPSPKFAEYSTKDLKKMRDAVKLKLVREPNSEANYPLQIQELTDEIERREDKDLKRAMNSVQAELQKAVNELKDQLKEKVPKEYWGHFDHCASSAGHDYHFIYKPQDIGWDTD